jgi:hypothetical protein
MRNKEKSTLMNNKTSKINNLSMNNLQKKTYDDESSSFSIKQCIEEIITDTIVMPTMRNINVESIIKQARQHDVQLVEILEDMDLTNVDKKTIVMQVMKLSDATIGKIFGIVAVTAVLILFAMYFQYMMGIVFVTLAGVAGMLYLSYKVKTYWRLADIVTI